MKIIVESERHIGKNPFDFLSKNIIPDGSFVSIGYITDGDLPKRCNITPKNDAELTNIINTLNDDLFKDFLIKFQNSKEYQDALIGKKRKTATLNFGDCHIIKISRTIVNWRNPEAFARLQAIRGEAIGDVRVKHGFGDYPEEYDEDDWRRAPEYGGTGRWEISKSTGRQGLPFKPMMNTPIYSYPGAIKNNVLELDPLYLRQYRNEGASHDSIWLFINQDQEYFLLNRKVMKWLQTAFKKSDGNDVIREINQEEKEFLKELHSIKYYDLHEEKMRLEKVLYLTGTTVDDNKNKEPFIWLNDDIVSETFPFLDLKKWIEIMRKCIDNSIIDTYTMNEKMIVLYHKSYLRKLNEQKRYRLRARRPLNELFGFGKKKDNKKTKQSSEENIINEFRKKIIDTCKSKLKLSLSEKKLAGKNINIKINAPIPNTNKKFAETLYCEMNDTNYSIVTDKLSSLIKSNFKGTISY